MNIPDDLQDIIIAAVRVHLALPYDAVVLPESYLIEGFGADIIDLRDIVYSIGEELGVPFKFNPAEINSVQSIITFVKQEYADACS